jgi:predicted nucleotidyltransferase
MISTTKPIWTQAALRARRDEIIELAARHGATHIRIFGSVVRGESRAGSDVDFLVSARPGTSVFEMVGLWREMQELLGCEVSLITDGISDPDFLRRITHEAIPL